MPPGKKKRAGQEETRRLRARLGRIRTLLASRYPEAGISLRFKSPLELLVATILSAQCTDVRVNEITRGLFRRYRSAEDYARADAAALMDEIRPAGFFRNKSRHIISAARAMEERHEGRVPRTMEELVALPGVGRKTANVILGNAFGVPGVVVDTHVKRISRRLGLTASTNPERIERDLMELCPPESWTLLSHQLIAHGRSLCRAPRPRCAECFLGDDLCPARRRFLPQ